MTSVVVDLRTWDATSTAGVSFPPGGRLLWRPVPRAEIGTGGDQHVLLSAAFAVTLTGNPQTILNVPPVAAVDGWCWEVREESLPGARTRYVLVPPSGTVNYAALVDVDPVTLTSEATPAWTAAAADLQAQIDGLTVGSGNVPPATSTPDGWVLTADGAGAFGWETPPAGGGGGVPAAHAASHAAAGSDPVTVTTGQVTGFTAAAAAAAPVQSVAARTGTVVLTTGDLADFREAVEDTVAALIAAGTGVGVTYADNGTGQGTLTLTATGGGGGATDPEVVRDTIGAALAGVGLVAVTVNDAADTITISTTATANATDAQLRDRGTHTGAQAISTVTGLQAALDALTAALAGKVDTTDPRLTDTRTPTDASVTDAKVATGAAISLAKTADSTAGGGRLALTTAERSKLTNAPVDTTTALAGKENTGVAAAAVAAHVAAADPHPGYLTPAEGNAAYAPVSHTHSGAGVWGTAKQNTDGTWPARPAGFLLVAWEREDRAPAVSDPPGTSLLDGDLVVADRVPSPVFTTTHATAGGTGGGLTTGDPYTLTGVADRLIDITATVGGVSSTVTIQSATLQAADGSAINASFQQIVSVSGNRVTILDGYYALVGNRIRILATANGEQVTIDRYISCNGLSIILGSAVNATGGGTTVANPRRRAANTAASFSYQVIVTGPPSVTLTAFSLARTGEFGNGGIAAGSVTTTDAVLSVTAGGLITVTPASGTTEEARYWFNATVNGINFEGAVAGTARAWFRIRDAL
jgi:hypothetical protein